MLGLLSWHFSDLTDSRIATLSISPARCFGAVTPVPVGLANPITHFSIGVRLAEHEADVPNVGSVGPASDGESHTLSSIEHRLA